jgi:predicted transcriptional regulator
MAPIILDSLELLGGSATLFEIAKAVERRPQGLRKPISKLVDHNVVLLQDDGRYTLADDASEALDKAAEVSGVAEMLERQRTFYAEERKRYEEVFKPILRGKQ